MILGADVVESFSEHAVFGSFNLGEFVVADFRIVFHEDVGFRNWRCDLFPVVDHGLVWAVGLWCSVESAYYTPDLRFVG